MRIIIVGCGKVGYTLAEQLREEGHEITVIDNDPEKQHMVDDKLDVSSVLGNGTSYQIQCRAGVEEADLLIAVTGKDELNLLSCLIAKKAGNCSTIARVRNPEYYDEINYIKEELGLSLAINPEKVAAMDAFNLIQVPSAMEIASFAKGRMHMVQLSLPKDSKWHDKRIRDLSLQSVGKFLISIIERDHAVIVPNGNTVLKEGDRISVILEMNRLNTLLHHIGIVSKKIRKVMIAGGGRIAYYLAQSLLNSHVEVKIIEKNLTRCQELSMLLPKAMIIYADATNETILMEEDLENMDAFVSLTNLDEENIMLSLYANKTSQAKLITKVNKIGFEKVIHDIPIGSILSPKYLTAEQIIQYVRSRQNSEGMAVESVYRMADNQVEALEFHVKEGVKVCGISLADMPIRKNVLIGAIIRKRELIIPSGQDKFMKGDTVIIVTAEKGLDDLADILAD